MDYDAVLDEIGSFGKFQVKILLWICFPVLYGAANAVSYVFIARTPPYRCFVDQCEQFDSAKYNQDWLQYAVPGSISNGQFVPEGCYKYNFNDTGLIGNNTCVADLFSKQRQKCDSWIFDKNEVTMINDWPSEMTCTENEWKLALIGTANFAGVMLGSAIFGFLADMYGRRTVFIGSLAFMSLTGIGQAVSNSYMMLLIFTLLNAAGTAGIYFSVFVLIIEMLHKSKREMSSVLLNYFFAIGGALVGITAYFERNWRNLTLWIAAPPIIFVVDYWLIPESACWLIANKYYSKAFKIIQKAAKDNKKELSSSIVSQFKGTNIDINISSDSISQLSQSENSFKTNYVAILKSRKLVLRILALFFIWGTNSLVFYGLSLYSVSLSGNIYLNFMYVSLAEIPGITIAWLSMNKIGRRSPLILSLMVCGICSFIGAAVSEELGWLKISMFLISKMAISTSFTITSVYTAEMMPTNIRSGCVGTFSTVARLTSLLAPFIPLLKNFHDSLPLSVFGTFSLASGLMSMLLPETLGSNLPDTVQEEKINSAMDYDTILEEIGGFGKFQIKILMLVCLPVLYGAANSLTYIFTARKPPYRCFVSECEQLESTDYSQDWLQNALPGSLSNGKFVPEGCYKYNFIQNINDTELTRNNTCFADLFGLEQEKCNSWIFSSDEVTIVNDWPTELTCTENQWKLAFAGTANFAGVMIGSALFGFLADYYGRRKIFIISIMFMSLSGIGQAISSSYLMFLIFTFLNAAGTAGIYFSAFILVIEIIDKNKREMSAVLLNYFYSFGGVLIGMTAYFDRNWRNLICWLSLPPILFIFFYRLIPESVCWLISNKLHSNAYKIVKKAAKINNKELSLSLTSQFEGNFIIDRKIPIDSSEKIEKPENASYAALFKSKILMVRILILCILWGTNALVFYGLSLNSVNLSGNIYYNFIFGSLIEIPGTTIAWISMNKSGRRYPLVFSFLICGVGCVWGAFSDNEALLLETLSFLISKMAISMSFTITTVYTAEMMPTNMRSGAVGTLSTVARLTSLLAPFIPLLKSYYSFLPLTVFGSFALVAGFMSLFLPETLGCDLPDTISEAEEMGV